MSRLLGEAVVGPDSYQIRLPDAVVDAVELASGQSVYWAVVADERGTAYISPDEEVFTVNDRYEPVGTSTVDGRELTVPDRLAATVDAPVHGIEELLLPTFHPTDTAVFEASDALQQRAIVSVRMKNRGSWDRLYELETVPLERD